MSGALSGSPQVVASQVSGIPAYAQSPNAMGGSCSSGPVSGLENGFLCDRATDDWGIALDARCFLTVTFPTVKNDAPGADPGTFVTQRCSTQTGRLGRRVRRGGARRLRRESTSGRLRSGATADRTPRWPGGGPREALEEARLRLLRREGVAR